MGKMGQFEDQEVRQAIARVTEVCHTAGVRLGIFGVSAAAVKPYIDQGYTLIVAGVDTLMLGQAARGIVTALKV